MVSFSIFLINFNPSIFSNYLQINMITPQSSVGIWWHHAEYFEWTLKSTPLSMCNWKQQSRSSSAPCRLPFQKMGLHYSVPMGHASWRMFQISACRTSSRLQTALLYSQLEVMIAPVKDWSNNFYGTSVFGIDRITSTDRTILLEAKPITYNKLQSFFM